MTSKNVMQSLEIEQLTRLLELSSQLTRKKIREFFAGHFRMKEKLSQNKQAFCEEVLRLAQDTGCISELIGVVLGDKPAEFIPPDEWELSQLVVVSTSAINHEHFEKGQDFVIENYDPSGRKTCLFTLCTHTKPYRLSRTVQAIQKPLQSICNLDDISIVFVSTPGIVPYEFDSLYPFAYYEWDEAQENPSLMSKYIDVCIERLDRFIGNFGKSFQHFVAYFKPRSESLYALQYVADKNGIGLIVSPDLRIAENIRKTSSVRWGFQGLRTKECLEDLSSKIAKLQNGRVKTIPIFPDSIPFSTIANKVIGKYKRKTRKWPPKPHFPISAYESMEFSIIEKRPVKVACAILSTVQCPYNCLMCGFWRDTLERIPSDRDFGNQLDAFESKIDNATEIKIFNSGSFFCERAMPSKFRDAIAERFGSYNLVSVEGRADDDTEEIIAFSRQVRNLEVALGLEVADSRGLMLLNKGFDLHKFASTVNLLKGQDILMKAYVLIGLPFFSENDSIHIVKKTIDFCRELEIETLSLLSTVVMPGVMERLASWNFFSPVHPAVIYKVLSYAHRKSFGRVLVTSFSYHQKLGTYSCEECIEEYKGAFREYNIHQKLPQKIGCECDDRNTEMTLLSPKEQLLICIQRATMKRKDILANSSYPQKKNLIDYLTRESITELFQ